MGGSPVSKPRYNSEMLDSFLTYLRDTRQVYRMAVQDELEANDETQDLLHCLELGGGSYHELAKLSKSLRTVRQERRQAKDKIICLQPVIDWMEENQSTIKGLERLLGSVRKAEKSIEGRIYHPKTNIVKDAIGEETQ